MFHRFCLLCLILCRRLVIARLPADVSPINTFEDVEGRLAEKVPGIHSIVYLNGEFYILSKNLVASLKFSSGESSPTELLVKEVISWPSSQSAELLCRQKTGDEEACNNFIRIFTPRDGSDREFLVCGTHSFDPKCRTYVIEGDVFKKDARSSEFSGRSICPYDPKQTGAYIYTNGDIYAATVEDFLGRKPVVYRHAVASEHTNLKGTKGGPSWLLDPWFVKLVESGPKVYILFKETAIEDDTGLTYSRVGQICKSDQGGESILRKQFTSYGKARLNCSYPGNPPFYFDELGAASDFYDVPGKSGQKFLFAAMNTPRNSIWGSAVCAYLQSDIETTLQKPYLEEHNGIKDVTYWSEEKSDPAVTEALGRCQFDKSGRPVLSAENLQFVRDHPLKAYSVPSWAKDGQNSIPIFMKLNAEYQLSAIAIDPAAGSRRQHFVIILGTTDGKILKVIPPLSDSMTEEHFIGETLAYDERKCQNNSEHDRQVRDIKIDKNNGYILVAFSSCVASIPLCPVSSSTCERTCISAQDPYCAWDGAKCLSVLRPEGGLKQDVLNGDVTGLPLCGTKTDGGTGSENNIGSDKQKGGLPLGPDSTGHFVNQSNTTASVILVNDVTTPVAALVGAASLSSNLLPGIVGVAIGIVLVVVVFLFCHLCKRSRKSSKTLEKDETAPIRNSTRQSSVDEKRNSNGQKQERPLSNNTQRQHSKRSNSSMEEDENGSEGNSNSIDKGRRKREKSSNRKSNTSSYRRENSLEKPAHPSGVNRQTSRESNHELGPNMEGSSNEQEPMFVADDFAQSPPTQDQHIHRTFSANARTEGMVPRHPSQKVRRQLSLQIPSNSGIVPKYHNLTPMRYGNQNPMEMHIQQHPNFVQGQVTPPQGSYEPTSAPTWHPSPSKNPHGVPRQYQTTSLDRKMLKARSQAHPPHSIPHDGQQQPRGYADTLPAPGMEDPKTQGRRRYTSESVVTGSRPAPLLFSKQPVYQSIEEETSPLLDQNSPTNFPSNMGPRNNGRMRPNHLPIRGSMEQPPQSNQYSIPYSNPGTPMNEQQLPRFAMSPMQNTGHTLPSHLRRQFAAEMPWSFATQQSHDFPHPQSTPNMKAYVPAEKVSKSNPATPEWDGNHNSFSSKPVSTAEVRSRNPSGRTTTPSTPMNGFPGFGHPDVIPTSTATRPSAETTYLNTNDALENTA